MFTQIYQGDAIFTEIYQGDAICKCSTLCLLAVLITLVIPTDLNLIKMGWVGVGVNSFFCVQLLQHFSMNFNQTFTEVSC